MRILEETKDYVIYYQLDMQRNPNLFYYFGQLCDLKTNKCYYKYQLAHSTLAKDVISLGKKLIKKWKKERNVK